MYLCAGNYELDCERLCFRHFGCLRSGERLLKNRVDRTVPALGHPSYASIRYAVDSGSLAEGEVVSIVVRVAYGVRDKWRKVFGVLRCVTQDYFESS